MPSPQTKTLLAKMRFLEWLSTRNDLTVEDLRLAIVLTSLWNGPRGYAWPSQDTLAAILGRHKRAIRRSVGRLRDAEIFDVRRPEQGRGHAIEYTPRFDRVPEGNIYSHEKEDAIVSPFKAQDAPAEKGTSETEKGTNNAQKGDLTVSPHPGVSEEGSIRSVPTASPDGDAQSLASKLKQLEGWIHTYKHSGITADEYRHLERRRDELAEIALEYDGHTGDGIGGWAGRLRDKIDTLLDGVEDA